MRFKEIIILIIVVFVAILLIIISNFREPPEPQEFVKNKSFATYSTLFFNYEIERYPTSVEIRPTNQTIETVLGVVTDPWNLNFGIVPAKGFTTRNIEVSNTKEKNIKIILKCYGNITPLVVFSKNNVILTPGEEVSIDIFLYSKGFEPGNYSGEIDVIAQKDIYNFLPIS